MDGTRFRYSRVAAWCALFAVCSLMTPASRGANWKSLAEQAREQVGRFQVVDRELALGRQRQNVLRRLEQVEEFLTGHYEDTSVRETWRRKLQLQRLAAQLSRSDPDPDQLRSIAVQFFAADEGLEKRPFIELRESLGEYEQALRIPDSPAQMEVEFVTRLAAVVDLLESEASHPDTVALDGHLKWLASAGQVPEFIESVQRQFSHPNVMLLASRETIASQLANISEDVDQTQFVSTTILGAQVSGDAHFQAKVTPEFVSDSPDAEIEIRIAGRVSAPNSVAVRRPVILYTSSTADVSARKRIYWKGLRLEAGPTSVEAVTCSQVNDVQLLSRSERRRRFPNPGARLITRLARGQAERQRADAEREASWQTEQRIAEQIDEIVSAKLAELNEQVQQSMVAPLTRLGILPQIAARNNGSKVRLEILKAGDGGLSAPAPPDWEPLEGLVALQIHETAITNFLRPVAAGARWSDGQLAQIQKQLLGDNSYEFRIGLHPRWELVMDSQVPVAAKIRDQSIRFEFNVRELRISGQTYAYPFCVAAQYRVKPTTTVLRLERLDEVELTWTGADSNQPDGEQAAYLNRFLRATFSGFFMEEAYTDGLETPSGGDWNAMSDLELRQVDLRAGWLRMAFDRSET